jgi:hypothetical protein
MLCWPGRCKILSCFPGCSHKYTKIVDSKLITNCPLGWANILVAERIFGTNLRALKGKTMYQLRIPVLGQIKGMPPTILE